MYNDYLKRKEKIIITAIDLLDEVGINGLTTKEIARKQNITEPAVYKQFDSKKEIVAEILNRFAAFDAVIRNTIIDNHLSGETAIFYFIKANVEYYQNYPQIATVMFSFDVFRYDADLNQKMNQIIKDKYNVLCEIIANSVDKGDFTDIDKDALADAIFGLLWSTILLWKMDGCKFDLFERIHGGVKLILGNCK